MLQKVIVCLARCWFLLKMPVKSQNGTSEVASNKVEAKSGNVSNFQCHIKMFPMSNVELVTNVY